MNFKTGQRYSAKKVDRDGYTFASKLEAALYDKLKIMELAGQIKIEKVQDHVRLTKAEILYIPDFRILDFNSGKQVWCESKGFESARWPMVKKLWLWYGPGELRIWKGTYQNIRLVETIVPRIWEGDTHQLSLALTDEA